MKIRTAAALTAALFVSGASAQIMAPCVPRPALEKMLLEKYHEEHVLTGIARGGSIAMGLYVSKDSWTIIHVQSLGDCAWIVSSGTDLMVMGDVPIGGEGL